MPNAECRMPKKDNGGKARLFAIRHGSSLSIRHRSAFRIRHSPLTGQGGFTFVELLVVTTILLILASAVLPLAKVSIQRAREAELRRSLREMRTAIDKYKDAADMGGIASFDIKAGTEGYPPSLETLVEGVTKAGDATGVKLKFLRRIPIDPITKSTEWGMRAYGDKPDSTSWGGGNVFDVYTKATGKALDGTKYRDW
jgi:general secretion pathway protein G